MKERNNGRHEKPFPYHCPSNCGKLTFTTIIISFADFLWVFTFIEIGSEVDWAVTAVHLYAVSCSPILTSNSYEATGGFPK